MMQRTSISAAFFLALVLLVSTSGTTVQCLKASNKDFSVAGWVETDAAVVPYIVVRVLDGNTGAVARSMQLDATHTFSFVGLPPTASEVQALVELPERYFSLNESASVLSVPLSAGAAHLKVVAVPAASLPAHGARHLNLSNVMTAGGTIVVLVCVWMLRHILTNLADRVVSAKAPKARKMMVGQS